jgi:hypothetical protein
MWNKCTDVIFEILRVYLAALGYEGRLPPGLDQKQYTSMSFYYFEGYYSPLHKGEKLTQQSYINNGHLK